MAGTPLLLTDADIRAGLTAADAVRWMGEAIDAEHRGDLLAPPRAHADLGDGRLVFTAGRLRGSWFGYRSYDSLPSEPGEQVVVVHDERSGLVRAVAVGNELGPRRVGAIGAVAADALAAPDAKVAAIIGTGTQAAMQVWGLLAVRDLSEFRVYSRDPGRRAEFAERVQAEHGVACRAAGDAASAVHGADIVVLATSSGTPVIDVSWLGRATYVATLGPKQVGRAEFDVALPAGAGLIVTDSLAQIDAYDPPNILAGTEHRDRLVSLGAFRAGQSRTDGRRVFFSVGLAGTEAFLLDRLAVSLRERNDGNEYIVQDQ